MSLAPLPKKTVPELLHLDRWVVIIIGEIGIVGILLLLAYLGL